MVELQDEQDFAGRVRSTSFVRGASTEDKWFQLGER